ncbi:hypothetical protein Q5752_000218 [Cryptotrichosporon argae]
MPPNPPHPSGLSQRPNTLTPSPPSPVDHAPAPHTPASSSSWPSAPSTPSPVVWRGVPAGTSLLASLPRPVTAPSPAAGTTPPLTSARPSTHKHAPSGSTESKRLSEAEFGYPLQVLDPPSCDGPEDAQTRFPSLATYAASASSPRASSTPSTGCRRPASSLKITPPSTPITRAPAETAAKVWSAELAPLPESPGPYETAGCFACRWDMTLQAKQRLARAGADPPARPSALTIESAANPDATGSGPTCRAAAAHTTNHSAPPSPSPPLRLRPAPSHPRPRPHSAVYPRRVSPHIAQTRRTSLNLSRGLSRTLDPLHDGRGGRIMRDFRRWSGLYEASSSRDTSFDLLDTDVELPRSILGDMRHRDSVLSLAAGHEAAHREIEPWELDPFAKYMPSAELVDFVQLRQAEQAAGESYEDLGDGLDEAAGRLCPSSSDGAFLSDYWRSTE